jgi:hypothetical protein
VPRELGLGGQLIILHQGIGLVKGGNTMENKFLLRSSFRLLLNLRKVIALSSTTTHLILYLSNCAV